MTQKQKPAGMSAFEWNLRQRAVKQQERAAALGAVAAAAAKEATAMWRAVGAYNGTV